MIVESNIDYRFYHCTTHRVECGFDFSLYFVPKLDSFCLPKLISFCLPNSGMISTTKMWLNNISSLLNISLASDLFYPTMVVRYRSSKTVLCGDLNMHKV